jgi:hypothetical protein
MIIVVLNIRPRACNAVLAQIHREDQTSVMDQYLKKIKRFITSNYKI